MNNKVSFYRPKEVNVGEFETIVNNMRDDFSKMCKGDFSTSEIKAYVDGLVAEAKPLNNRPSMKFWGLDEPNRMPPDARVEFFYIPTYIATAFLIRAVLISPDIMESHIVRRTLAAALLGSTGRGFAGHGYENDIGRVRTLKIFASAGARTFVDKYPYLCPKFTRLYEKTMDDIKAWVDDGAAVDAWGSDFSDEAREVLQIDFLQKQCAVSPMFRGGESM